MYYQKILIVKFRSLGDTVILTASLEELKKAYPRSEIHVAVTSRWASILEGNPHVTKIWPYDRHEDAASRAKAIARLTLKLRKERFDCVANFHASTSSSVLSFGIGASTRAIHFHGHKHKNRYSTVEIFGKGIPRTAIERDMDTLRGLGVKIPEGLQPKVYIQPAEREFAKRFFADSKLRGPLLALGLGASRPTKQWPVTHYAEIAHRWVTEMKGGCYPIVDVTEESLGVEFLSAYYRLIENEPNFDALADQVKVLPKFSIRQIAALLSETQLYCGNDSGPKHLSVALGIPTVSLLGPEDPFEWHPYPQDLHPYHFVPDLTCRKDALPGMPPWCGLHLCIQERHRCMTGILPGTVFDTCKNHALKESART